VKQTLLSQDRGLEHQMAVKLRRAKSAPEEATLEVKKSSTSSAGWLVPVELAAGKSQAPHEPSCGLAVVPTAARRIEVHPDFDGVRSSAW